jgi:predicted dehydrogenase
MKRRDFIFNSIMGSIGISVAASAKTSGTFKGPNDKIVIALIGAGDRGLGTIISTARLNPGVEIKTICDVKKTRLEIAGRSIEKELGYRPGTTNNMREIFDDKDVDAVWISTPEHWHALATVWACQAGKDVYVEKNPALSISEGQKMIRAAGKYNRIVQVGFQNRSAPYGFSAREYIKSGRLGKIVEVKCYNMLGGKKWVPQPDQAVPDWIDWDGWLGPAPYRPYNPGITIPEGRGGWLDFWAFGGGTLSDDASHVMDLARMVLGDPPHPVSVYTCGGNRPWGSEKETPEFMSIIYDFKDFTLTCDSGIATNYMKKTPEKIRMDPGLFPDWRTNATRTEIYGTEGLMYLGRHGGGWQVVGGDSTILEGEGGVFPDADHQVNFINSLRSREKPNGNVYQGHMSASLVHFGNIAYRAGNRQLLIDPEKEMFTNDEDANDLLRASYREHYAMPDNV